MEKLIITTENIETIIGKFQDQRISKEEWQALNTWRNTSSENEDYFQSLCKIDNSYRNLENGEIDVDKAWLQVNGKINGSEQIKRESGFWKYVGYVASIVLLLSTYYFSLPEKKVNEFVSQIDPLELDLKDGSSVIMGPNSMLTRLQERSRSYRFTGQATFEVIHDDEKPFTVIVDDIIVQDLGTVFEVVALPGSDTVHVQVQDGLVRFYTEILVGIHLEEGEEGMYIKSRNEFYKRSIDPASAYLSKKFKDVNLRKVADHLAYAFRKTIEIEDTALENCDIAVDFSKASYKEVIEIIEDTLNITFKEEGNKLVLSGNGCR